MAGVNVLAVLVRFAATLLSAHGIRHKARRSETQQTATSVTVSGRNLLVNGRPFHMKGICWNPVGKGNVHPQDLDFTGFVDRDSAIMQDAGINTVRPYEPITDRSVLDTFYQRGIYVVNAAYSWGGAPAQSAANAVNAVKDHPAIIMWAVGNEWNYNGLYYGMSFNDARARIAEVVDVIKAADPNHPVSTVYGELPDWNTLNILSRVDVWGINAYRGISMGNLYNDWKYRSPKPMYFGEYGADAWDARFNAPGLTAQADATRELTNEIIRNSAVTGGVCMGGMIFEFADEWWKDGSGSPNRHDTGGVAPGGGPHPDMTFNEEWWGLLDINRMPRPAFWAFAASPIPE